MFSATLQLPRHCVTTQNLSRKSKANYVRWFPLNIPSAEIVLNVHYSIYLNHRQKKDQKVVHEPCDRIVFILRVSYNWKYMCRTNITLLSFLKSAANLRITNCNGFFKLHFQNQRFYKKKVCKWLHWKDTQVSCICEFVKQGNLALCWQRLFLCLLSFYPRANITSIFIHFPERKKMRKKAVVYLHWSSLVL